VAEGDMTSKREEVLSALHALLATLDGVDVQRNTDLPVAIPAGGLLILRDGTPGDAVEVTLSPMTHWYEHRVEVEAYWQARTAATRDAEWDALARRIGGLVVENRTLGGRCDWVDAEAVEPTDLPVYGGDGIKAATITLVLHYGTANPLI
jgi:hypothetical protein